MSSRLNRLLTFAHRMILTGDVVRSAADAGATGTESELRRKGEAWLEHPDVKDILAAVKRKDVLVEAAKGAALTELKHELRERDGRLAWLERIMDGTTKRQVVSLMSGEVIEAEAELKDKLAAFKMYAHMHGDFVERKEIAVSSTARVIAVWCDNGRGPLPPGAEVVAEIPAELNEGDV